MHTSSHASPTCANVPNQGWLLSAGDTPESDGDSGIERVPSQEIQPENEAIKTQPQGVQPGEILIWDVTQQVGGRERKERETINGKCVI